PIAANIGTVLAQTDSAKNRDREDQVGTALPRRATPSSHERFPSVFIARVTRSNDVRPGAIFDLGFAALAGNSAQLTSAGHQFAEFANPVLDGAHEEATATLSAEEKSYLLGHMAEHYPAEAHRLHLVIA